ncbi:UAA transporter [Coemansia reversa NRRL 1564]|uniref:UDP-galactose transporter homolog 1 n=1 Tax=Coemansia reversa (strain ATCC 12441 / NRRL 1564) TaxID=763665 RepID=A0A2G5BJP8_COERN|nr:UAA transporter [Coemansia reversa NRRL 1564]|eukprot:PIA19233.1 UAA transporter [Coemansia reversa NRRL 1564]
MLDFVVCVGGIYVCFLTWSALQERVTTALYGEDHQRFRFTIVLNMLQAMAAALVGYVYIHFIQRKPMLKMNRHRWKRFFQVAVLNSSASPFGYMALRYINYPTMTLAKTCKMVPVMFMNKILYRRHYPSYKYAVVAMITTGVSAFMLFKSSEKSKSGSLEAVENSLYGLLLVLINLAIDGAVNSTQDQIFAEDAEITGQHMMCLMNLCSTVLMAVWLLNPFNPELVSAARFLHTHPQALVDIGMFAVCGAMGQCFVFYTLARFGSLTLTTVTVTRKFLTILISVFYNGHKLNSHQWSATGLVFTGISLDVYKKQTARRAIIAAAVVDTKDEKLAESEHEVLEEELLAEVDPLAACDVPELVALQTRTKDSDNRATPLGNVRRRRLVDVAAA